MTTALPLHLMDHPCTPGHGFRTSGRSTFGEALIVIAAVLGFAIPYALGYQLTVEDAWTYAGFLLIVVLFYFLLLLCRAIFIFITSGENFQWEKWAEPKKRDEPKRH